MDHKILFDQELEELKGQIIKMGELVTKLITQAMDALVNRDENLARQVINDDVLVDQLELEIDDRCVKLIAIRQPMATDLRTIMTGMRIATDLERVGDLAQDIAERAIELARQELVKPLVDLPQMVRLAQEALEDALLMFRDNRLDLVKEIWEKEKKVDDLRDRVQEELIEIMEKKPQVVQKAVPLLLVARHLERIADHATNIAEDVVYMIQARVVKHGGG